MNTETHHLTTAPAVRDGRGLKRHGDEEPVRLAALEQPQLPQLLNRQQLRLLRSPPCLIDPYLPLNRIVQLFGASGVGKSYVMLDMALTVAQYTSVLYIPSEALEDYDDRVTAWEQHYRQGAGQVHFWNDAIDLLDRRCVDHCLAAAVSIGARLIVIDTLASAMPTADDREGREVKAALRSLHRLREATQACIALVHHSGWDAGRERGHSSLRAACRVVMKLAARDELITLSVDKINGAKAPPPRGFRLVSVGPSAVPVPASKVTERGMQLSEAQTRVLGILQLEVHQKGARFSDVAMSIEDMAKSSLSYALSRLLKLGLIYQDEKRYFHLTDAGSMYDCEGGAESEPVARTHGFSWTVNESVCVWSDDDEQEDSYKEDESEVLARDFVDPFDESLSVGEG